MKSGIHFNNNNNKKIGSVVWWNILGWKLLRDGATRICCSFWISLHTHTNPGGTLISGHLQSSGWQPLLGVAWCLIWWFASIERSMTTHATEYPYWDPVSYALGLNWWMVSSACGWSWDMFCLGHCSQHASGSLHGSVPVDPDFIMRL